MGKKIGFSIGFGAVWAGMLYLVVRFWVFTNDDLSPARMFYALLLMMLLLWGGLTFLKKRTGNYGMRDALFLIGCGAVFSFGALAIGLLMSAGRERARLAELAAFTFGGYLELLFLSFVVVRTMHRDKPLATFHPINSAGGKKAVRVVRIVRILYYVILAVPVSILLDVWLVSDRWWALALMLFWIFATLVGYSVLLTRYTNNLLLKKIDPAAFYDVQVWLYDHSRKRTHQSTILLNLVSAYVDLDQLSIADQLMDKLETEPLAPANRPLYHLRRAVACRDAAAFPALRDAARAALSTSASPALRQQGEVLLAGSQAGLENHPQGLLWYADQIEAMASLSNPRNLVAAALSRGQAFALLDETEKSRAAYRWALEHCGGSLLMRREAAEGLAALPGETL